MQIQTHSHSLSLSLSLSLSQYVCVRACVHACLRVVSVKAGSDPAVHEEMFYFLTYFYIGCISVNNTVKNHTAIRNPLPLLGIHFQIVAWDIVYVSFHDRIIQTIRPIVDARLRLKKQSDGSVATTAPKARFCFY